ncbi:MAG: tRNA uridine-5-carboxymethylaminomethyl(34) synthesis GTPase MnmE [Crocinitomicaceae bacterium]|nr:tRNA uridine-5-carboxymethylaminomethyl(34) synthesis GTPase MnmE [Crocinitomicaceae bacterium]
MFQTNDTICALATPNGIGAIALIRISGTKSLVLTEQFFSKPLQDKASHTSHFGLFSAHDKTLIDEVLVCVFSEGKSFTGEESVEISCHASPYIQQQILQTLCAAGCRLAEPGEFTRRAFLNGKLDLSQAEAIADLIASQSRQAHLVALRQLRGNFSSELKDLREKLIHFASLIELELDFSEEDVEFADRSALKTLISEVLGIIKRLAKSFDLGNALKNGVPVALVGAPNTGKSTLLNQLLGEERAIVSNIPGTTRDVIEETLNIDGILFRLIDTAGIRETEETIETMGIARSQQKIEQASIVLCLADANDTGSLSETTIWVAKLKTQFPEKHILLLVNKADLNPNLNPEGLCISAKTGTGIEELKNSLVSLVVSNFDLQNETIVSSARHYEALLKTSETLEKAQIGLEDSTSADFIAMDIRQAMYHLGTITGDISTDDLLGNIFSKFCIGK